jgi:hypothetical protein
MADKYEEISRFLEGIREGGFQCTLCGRNNYSVMLAEPAKDNERVAAEFSLDTQIEPYIHTVMGISCTHCGLVHFFDQGLVDKWIKKHRPGRK